MQHTPHIFMRDRDRIIKVHLFDILFLEAADKYVKIYTVREKEVLMIRTTLDRAEARLRHPVFIRVSRTYIVNIHHVDFVQKDTIRITKHDLPLQKQYASAFIRKLLLIN